MLAPLKALYESEPTIPLSLLIIVDSLGSGFVEAGIQLIANELFD